VTDYVLLKLSSMISDYGEEILGRMSADYESVYKSVIPRNMLSEMRSVILSFSVVGKGLFTCA